LAQAAPLTNEAILAELNRVRTDPVAYADWLERSRAYYQNTVLSWPGQPRLQTVEGSLALDDALAQLRQMASLPPLVASPGLTQAATDHAQDLIQSRRFTSQGSDGSTPEERVHRYGMPAGVVQELLSQAVPEPAAIVASWVVDDGNPSRSYRQAVLRPDWNYAGLRCQPQGNLALCVTLLATAYTEASGNPDAQPEGESVDPFTQPLTPELLRELAAGVVAETNQVRTDPAGYAAKLAALRPYYEGDLVKIPGQPAIRTVEGVAALDEAIAALNSPPPVSALRVSPGLNQAAADHANDIGPRGGVGHAGTDDSLPGERIQRYGTLPPNQRWGENISYGPPTLAEWHVMQLLIDDNVPDRGHRQAMLRPEYQLTGSACAPHAIFRIVCVVTYASAYEE
jgi:uncharacterized protein YkwD